MKADHVMYLVAFGVLSIICGVLGYGIMSTIIGFDAVKILAGGLVIGMIFLVIAVHIKVDEPSKPNKSVNNEATE